MSNKRLRTEQTYMHKNLPPYNTPDNLYKKCNQLQKQLEQYSGKQKKWNQEKQSLMKTLNIMKMELNKTKDLNNQLIKKCKHKRASSEERTFIFNQTNISSYYPVMNFIQKITPLWTLKQSFNAHLDSVRCLKIVDQHNQNKQGCNIIVSGGDDSQLKIWQNDTLKSTIRQHLGPIHSVLCSGNQKIITGGAQGVLRYWNISNIQHPYLICDLQAHDDSIWQIKSKQNMMITSSSDGFHKIFRLNDQNIKQLTQINIENKFPTAIEMINSAKFVSGYTQKQQLICHDIQKNKIDNTFYYESKSTFHQANTIVYNCQNYLFASGHEDHQIRLFDVHQKKPIKTVAAHSDSVTAICFNNNFQLMSVSHDGSFRVWDLRKYRCLCDIGVHMRKYDQSALALDCSKKNFTVIGGADGCLKFISPEH